VDHLTIRLLTTATPVEKLFSPDSISGNTITTTTNHGFSNGQAVRYDAPDPKGFVNYNVDVTYQGTEKDGVTAKFADAPDANNIYFTNADFQRIAHGFATGDRVLYNVEEG
ncbi:hypothetical protein RZS08_64885, partial [Arthrospira platensis SPKY1]|nr:hypothetical protein [Arthrospira platensis SPKY1]